MLGLDIALWRRTIRLDQETFDALLEKLVINKIVLISLVQGAPLSLKIWLAVTCFFYLCFAWGIAHFPVFSLIKVLCLIMY